MIKVYILCFMVALWAVSNDSKALSFECESSAGVYIQADPCPGVTYAPNLLRKSSAYELPLGELLARYGAAESFTNHWERATYQRGQLPFPFGRYSDYLKEKTWWQMGDSWYDRRISGGD